MEGIKNMIKMQIEIAGDSAEKIKEELLTLFQGLNKPKAPKAESLKIKAPHTIEVVEEQEEPEAPEKQDDGVNWSGPSVADPVIARACTKLVDADPSNKYKLSKILSDQFNCRSIMDLKDQQKDEFVEIIREMGAKI